MTRPTLSQVEHNDRVAIMIHLLSAFVENAERLIRKPKHVQLVASWSGIQVHVLLSNAGCG